MKIVFDAGRFVAVSSFEERVILKGAGFRWNPDARVWWTDKPAVALKVANAFDPSAKEAAQEAERHIEASKKTDHDIAIPCPEGLAYLPFQRAGIAYCLKMFGVDISKPHHYIMGVGKEVINANRDLSEKAATQGENDGVHGNGPDSGGARNCYGKTEKECGKRNVADAGVDCDKNQNARPGGSGTSFERTEKGIQQQIEFSGRERATTDGNGLPVGGGAIADGVQAGACNSNAGPRNFSQTARPLQGGLWRPLEKGGGGIGRTIPSTDEKENFGQEKNRGATSAGLASDSNKTQIMKGGQTPSLGVLIADEMG